MSALQRSPTLLCTSQGLVMADKSQPVIIMALKVWDKHTVRGTKKKKNRTCNTLMICRGLLSQKSPHLSKINLTDFSQHVQSVYIHDDFLPDGVVGNKSRGLFFVCHWLRGIHDVLEHGSLSVWRETGHINWVAFLQLLRSRLRLAVVLRLALTVAAKRPICSKPTWSKAPDLWRWCRRRTSAAHSQTDASGGCRRCSSSAGDHK